MLKNHVKNTVFRCFCALTVALFPMHGEAQKLSFHIEQWTLKNKTEVFFVRRTELPMLDVQMVFDAGSVRDDQQSGIAAFVNSMMGEGAENLSSDQIAKNFENVGAQFSSFANRDMAGVSLRTLTDPKYLSPALHNFKIVITTPTFPLVALNRVKQQTIAGLQSEAQDPQTIAKNAFFAALYPHHPYGTNPLGNAKSIQAFTPKELTAFYKKYYVGANADLILVGDITESDARKIADEVAGSLPEGVKPTAIAKAEKTDQPASVDINFPATQSTVLIGQVGITRHDPNYFPLIVGNAVLGGLPMSSILYEQVRDKRGLAYVVGSGFDPLAYRGPFLMEILTKSSSVVETKTLAMDLLKQYVETGPTEAQLIAAKKNLMGAFPLSLASNRGILSAVTNVAFYHRPLGYFDTYVDQINAVTVDQVKKAFEHTVNTKKMVTVVVGQK